jgi:hypothetical protein
MIATLRILDGSRRAVVIVMVAEDILNTKCLKTKNPPKKSSGGAPEVASQFKFSSHEVN